MQSLGFMGKQPAGRHGEHRWAGGGVSLSRPSPLNPLQELVPHYGLCLRNSHVATQRRAETLPVQALHHFLILSVVQACLRNSRYLSGTQANVPEYDLYFSITGPRDR